MEKIFYPITQRRLRTDAHIRELTASVKLSHRSFIQPVFVDEAINEPRFVEGLYGVRVDTIHTVLNTIEDCIHNGISKFLLFPVRAAHVNPLPIFAIHHLKKLVLMETYHHLKQS